MAVVYRTDQARLWRLGDLCVLYYMKLYRAKDDCIVEYVMIDLWWSFVKWACCDIKILH